MAILIQIPATEIQLLNASLIVNPTFLFKLAKNRGFWTQATCLPA